MKDSEDKILGDGIDGFSDDLRPSESRVRGMYREYFLDYASYVILERAVPSIQDGLKPVQRRLLHALKEMDDGRFHKVANVIGQTMKYHPHGDASIGDALVQLGQKNILIDSQGNWGNIFTGDSAAASRYIEARLSTFALDVAFNPKITQWQSSYDGRGKEPIDLPMKFPLLLAQGVEGIAVGLSTKILPHNFIELIDGSISILRGRSAKVYPDFPTGGIADFTQYNDGLRGGRVRIRAKISVLDKKTLVISELPFSMTTQSLIDSIIKANEKGKIKIKKIEDNTAEKVEIVLHLVSGVSPDQTVDALYAFTSCEISISPLSCVIENDRPLFSGISEILKISTENTTKLLKAELEINLHEQEELWHFASLEKIFIQHKIYRDIEEAETWEQVLENIWEGLKPYIDNLIREVTENDIIRLTEIKIKRISKFDASKADKQLLILEERIAEIKSNLKNLVDFSIDYFKNLKKKFGKGKERKTEIRTFNSVVASKVALANVKLYVNREEGFIGTALKKHELICECSDLDDILIIRKDGTLVVTKVDSKKFVGVDILYAGVYRKGDDRTIYNLIYRDGLKGASFIKRFAVGGVTRDKEYPLTQGNKGSLIHYLSVNPNGEAETVSINLRAVSRLKKLKWDIDFAKMSIRSRTTRGNTVTKETIKRVELKAKGISTLDARKLWFDDTVLKINDQGRGVYLGAFQGDEHIIQCDKKGRFRIFTPNKRMHFDEVPFYLSKYKRDKSIGLVYFDGNKEKHFVKRCSPEIRNNDWDYIINEHAKSTIEIISQYDIVEFEIEFSKIKGKEKSPERFIISDLISVKGLKATGNRISPFKIKKISLLSEKIIEIIDEFGSNDKDDSETKKSNSSQDEVFLKPVDTNIDVVDLERDHFSNNREANPKLEEDSEEDGQFTLEF
jgi:topoisomerase-4 subunit A